jgi:hypothetical protein
MELKCGSGLSLGLTRLLCSPGGVLAQKTKGKTREAETKFLMRGINQPNSASLAKLLKAGPADDKTWEQVDCHASILDNNNLRSR